LKIIFGVKRFWAFHSTFSRLEGKDNLITGNLKMTKNQILSELLLVGKQIATHKRGQGDLTALKAYQRKLYKDYMLAK
jgi:hypothetical protein